MSSVTDKAKWKVKQASALAIEDAWSTTYLIKHCAFPAFINAVASVTLYLLYSGSAQH